MARKKVNKEEVVEEEKEEVVKEEVKTPERPARKINVWSELKSFFIILVIIGLFVLGGWAWYSSMKDHTDNNDGKDNGDHKYAYRILGKEENLSDNFITTEDDAGYINRITDIKGNMLLDEATLFTHVFVGVDNNTYLVSFSDEEEGAISFGILKNKKVEKKYNIETKPGYYTHLLFYTEEDYGGKLAGFVQSEELADAEDATGKTYIINLENKASELEGYKISSSFSRLSIDDDYYSFNDTYIPFANEDDSKYGLYDYRNGKVVIDANYDFIHPTVNGTFIAEKNNKTGIIDAKEKVLVVFEYDYIDSNKGFYVVGKDEKLAIMNKNHEFVTGFEFKVSGDYTYKPCCANNNDFSAIKYGDKFLLISGRSHYGEDDIREDLYIIYANGKYESIENSYYDIIDEGLFIFDEKSKTYAFYDNDLEEKFTIDVSSYAFAKEPQYFYSFGNIIGICEKDVHFDKDTGKEIEFKDFEYTDGNFKFKYDRKNITLYIDGKEIYKYEAGIDDFYTTLTKTDYGYSFVAGNGSKNVLIYKK